VSHIQAFINCDVPGFGDVGTSPNNITYTDFSVIGFATFRDWIAGLTSTVTGLSFSYDQALDRVTVENTTVSQLYVRVSESSAQALGLVSTVTTIPGNTTHTGGRAPAGIVPLKSVDILDSSPAQRTDLRPFSHGRARSIVFGSGTYHRAKLVVLYADLERLLGGPCTAGRVRVGDLSASSAFSSANVGGYIEASVLRVNSPSELDEIEGISEIVIDLHASAYTAPDPFDPFFASLERGYSVNFYAKIEGADRLFTEIDTGLSASPRTTSATLVMGSSTSIAWRVERDSGRVGGGPIQIGILDPDNDLEIFGLPTKKTEIAASVAFDANQFTVTDGSQFPGPFPHPVYIGKELMVLTGVVGDTMVVSRGSFGPRYDFAAEGPSAYTTVSDRCHVFTGKIVELWGQLLDPFGRSVAAALDDQWCRMLHHGELTGTPGYDAGVWALHLHPLENRLKRELGTEFTQVLPGINTGEDGVIAAFDADPRAPIRSTDVIQYDIDFRTGVDEWYQNTFLVTIQDLIDSSSTVFTGAASGHAPLITEHVGGADHAVSVQAFVKKVVEMTAAFLFKKSAASAQDEPVNKYFQAAVEKVKVIDSVLWFNVVNQLPVSSPWPSFSSADVRIMIHPPAGVAGTWWRRPIAITHDAPYGAPSFFDFAAWGEYASNDIEQAWQEIGLGGKDCPFLTINSSPDVLGLSGSFLTNPAGGVVVDAYFLAEDGETELIRSERAMGLQDGRILVWKLSRTLQQTQAVDLFAHDVKIHAISNLTGTFGVQIAKVLQGSGTSSRGAYDLVGAHSGYGIEDIHIDEGSIVGFQPLSAPTFVPPKQSLVKLFGGLLGSLRHALGPVRSGQRLKIGIVPTRPVGLPTMKLMDSDLRRDRPPSVQRVGVGPNIVEFNRTRVPGIDTKTTITYRLLADIQARGGVSGRYDLPGANGFIFDALAAHAAGGIMMSAMDLIAYRFHVGPHKDWLPGQICNVNITHPGVYDWHRDTTGLQALGVIMDTRRRFNGECEITVLVAGSQKPAALCPSVNVTDLDGLNLTVSENEFPNGSAIFEGTNQALVYRAGVLDCYTEVRIGSISADGLRFTLDSAPSWLTALDGAVTASTAVFITYPSDDNGSITELQEKGFAHFSDGGTWE
jgi:hypothetical protein